MRLLEHVLMYLLELVLARYMPKHVLRYVLEHGPQSRLLEPPSALITKQLVWGNTPSLTLFILLTLFQFFTIA